MPIVHLHDSPSVVLQPGSAAQPLRAREAALFCWLHLEGPSTRGALAGRFWPQGDDGRARTNLRQLLARLRRFTRDLIAESDGVLSLAADVKVVPRAGRLLGPLEFDDVPELAAWLEARRDAERRDRQRQGLAAAREALAGLRLDEALAAADAVLSDDTAVEEAHRLRMRVFWQRGDRAAAVQAWDDCRHALRQAFGIAPSADTETLGHQILADEARGRAPSFVSTPAPSSPLPCEPGVPANLPEALRRPVQLVGRDEVLASAASALSGGRGLLVCGPGGIGKTRLLATLLHTRGPALCAGGRPGDELVAGALASRLMAEALARFDPLLDATVRADTQRLLASGSSTAGAVPSEAEHRRVLASLAQVLRGCWQRGLRLLVLDDLQYADDLSIEALALAIGQGAIQPMPASPDALAGSEIDTPAPEPGVVPLLACRRDELGASARRLIEALEASGRVVRIDLAPLDLGSVARLVAALPAPPAVGGDADALAPALHARVGGNPAYLLESLRSLWRAPPASWRAGDALPLANGLREQVSLRLARLPPEALQLAQLAAVAQREFSLPLAAAGLGCAPLALAPLFTALDAAQVFQGGGFAHDLVAEAVSASLPATLRGLLHRLVADHLQQHQGEPATIAHHLQAAGDALTAARWCLKAGHRAQRQWRLEDATRQFDDAAPVLRLQGERAAACEALCGAARALALRSMMAASEERLAQAWALAGTDAERVQVLALRVPSWLGLHRQGQVREGVAHLLELLERLGPASATSAANAGQDDDGVRAWFAVAWGARLTRLATPARLLLQRSLEAANPETRPFLQMAEGMLLQLEGDMLGACARLRAALPWALERRQFGWLLNASQALARAALAAGDIQSLDRAVAWMVHALQEGGFGGGFHVDVEQVHAMRALALGEPGQALQHCTRAQHILRDLGRAPRVQLETLIAAAELALGQPAAAAARLAALPPADGGPDVDEACRYWVWVRCLHRLGQPVQEALIQARNIDPRCDHSRLSVEHQALAASVGLPSQDTIAQAELASRPALEWLLTARQPIGQADRDPWLGP